MAYVYRYIDLEAQEVVYIGKVKTSLNENDYPLRRRHEQHQREEWYKKNADNLIMQYIETKSHADADILETWLISQYGTGQLINKSKTGWGKSDLDLWSWTHGRWRTYLRNCSSSKEALYDGAEILYRMTDGLEYDVDSSLGIFCEIIKDIVSEKRKAGLLSRYDAQDEFLRPRIVPKKEDEE